MFGLVIGAVVFAAILGFLHLCGVGLLKSFVGVVLATGMTFVTMAFKPEATLPALVICSALAAAIVHMPDVLRRRSRN